MLTETYGNIMRSSLAAAVTSNSQTTITIASAGDLPASGNYRIRVLTEFMLVTGGQGTTTLTVTRGVDGSTALSSIDIGAAIYQVVTRGTLDHIIQNHSHTGSTEGIGIASGFFGDGSDGDVTISADTTLTSNKFYNNLTINAGKVLNTSGYIVFVAGTLTNNGTISNDGVAGSTSNTADGGGAGYFLGGGKGGWSGVGTSVASGMGGGGGQSDAPSAGGTVTAPTLPLRTMFFLISAGTLVGGGGGGGGRGSTISGGGGGGVVCIVANTVVNSGVIRAIGGAGLSYAGWHSGGGGGGLLIIAYRNATWGTESAAGGASGGGSATAGSNGTVLKFPL